MIRRTCFPLMLLHRYARASTVDGLRAADRSQPPPVLLKIIESDVVNRVGRSSLHR